MPMRKMNKKSRKTYRKKAGKGPYKIKSYGTKPGSTPTYYFTRYANINTAYSISSSNAGIQIQTTAGGSFSVNTAGLAIFAPAGTLQYTSLAFAPCLEGLPNVTEFTNLFDKYKITGVRIKLICVHNTFPSLPSQGDSGNDNGGMGIPVIHSVIDPDDYTPAAASDAGIDALRAYNSYKIQRLDGNNRVWSRYLKYPAVNIVSEAGSSSGIAVTKRSPWIDCAFTNVPHHGLKLMIETFNPTGTGGYEVFKVELKYYMKMSFPR